MAWNHALASAQDLSAGDLTVLDGASAVSFHAWCRLTDDTADRHALSKFDGTNGMRLYYETAGINGKVKIPKCICIIGGVTTRAEGGTDNTFTTNVWHSFGGSWKPNDASGIKVYLDGVLEGSGSTTGHTGGTTFPDLAANLYVGRQSSGTSAAWVGQTGEVAAWTEELDAEDWKALSQGVPAYMVRPWALVFYSAMRNGGTTEHYWLPQAGTTADFTITGSTTAEDGYPYASPFAIEEQDGEFTAGGTSYTSWAKIQDNLTSSAYLDTGLVNGTEYQYYVVAVDTSNNPSSASSSASVTPSATAEGPPRPIPYPKQRKHIPGMRLREEEQPFFK